MHFACFNEKARLFCSASWTAHGRAYSHARQAVGGHTGGLPRSERDLRFSAVPLHCGFMRQTLRLAPMIALAMVLGGGPAPIRSGLARAESSTNDLSAIEREADTCARRLHEIHGEAVRLEEKAPKEQTALIDCIRSRELKIKGLLELTESARKNIDKALRGGKTEAIEEFASDVKISCARAEKLLIEAEECATSVVLKAVPTNAAPVAATNASGFVNINIRPRAIGPSAARRPVVRTDQTCLHQEQFAAMLARAMDLKMDAKATPDEFIRALTKLAVEPLHGWQTGRCATVDDVYVACARAMNLKVKDPQDPLSYGEALREEGLGVDTLLPERDPHLDPPYVLDSEVRALLTTGYAAPLPSSRRVTPD